MIFLDSSYLIGLIVDNDKHHEKSHELQPILTHEKKMINNTVLTEVLNSLKKNNYHWNREKVIKTLLKLDIVDYLSYSILIQYNYLNIIIIALTFLTVQFLKAW